MKRKPSARQEAATRIADALRAPDTLSCDAARTLLPALVAAEQAGVDVDADPAYAALLRHFDYCAACLELYAQLAAALAPPSDRLPPDVTVESGTPRRDIE